METLKLLEVLVCSFFNLSLMETYTHKKEFSGHTIKVRVTPPPPPPLSGSTTKKHLFFVFPIAGLSRRLKMYKWRYNYLLNNTLLNNNKPTFCYLIAFWFRKDFVIVMMALFVGLHYRVFAFCLSVFAPNFACETLPVSCAGKK